MKVVVLIILGSVLLASAEVKYELATIGGEEKTYEDAVKFCQQTVAVHDGAKHRLAQIENSEIVHMYENSGDSSSVIKKNKLYFIGVTTNDKGELIYLDKSLVHETVLQYLAREMDIKDDKALEKLNQIDASELTGGKKKFSANLKFAFIITDRSKYLVPIKSNMRLLFMCDRPAFQPDPNLSKSALAARSMVSDDGEEDDDFSGTNQWIFYTICVLFGLLFFAIVISAAVYQRMDVKHRRQNFEKMPTDETRETLA